MYYGSCLCGAIRLEVDGTIESIIHCHCSLCRKTSGTAYATNGFVDKQAFRLISGDDSLAFYERTPGKKRYFCRICASPIYSSNAASPDRLRLRLGVLDSDIAERPVSHNFFSSKAVWDDPDADIPRYDAYEPGR